MLTLRLTSRSQGPGECRPALTVVNETPDYILVVASGDPGIQCGGDNEYFRADDRRACTMRVNPAGGNRFAVPLITLLAYFPSGDPDFPRGGQVEWYAEDGQREACNNAYSEYCQIAMGQDGSPPTQPARPHSRTITVRYVASP